MERMFDFPIIWGLGIKGELATLIILILVGYRLWKWLLGKLRQIKPYQNKDYPY